MRLKASAAALVGAAALALTLGGCSFIPSLVPKQEAAETPSVETAAPTPEATAEGGTVDVFTLSEGDCLDDESLASDGATDGEVTSVPTLPCTEPHDFEVFANVIIPDADAYPGESAVTEKADAECAAAFPDFVGIDYDSSIYGYSYYYPTDGSWADGDRTINCLIGDPAGKTTGSLAGIAR